MRIFVTGASGFIGSRVVPELISAGHQVVGLARSDPSAAALRAAGAEVQRGDLEDIGALRTAAADSEGVIHLAFIHDFSRFEESARIEQRAIEALGEALEGSGRPLLISSGALGITPGRVSSERDMPSPDSSPRQAGVRTALSFVARGVRTSIVRLSPTVHGPRDKGFIAMLVSIARRHGFSAYIGDGSHRWPAVHVLDAARLYRLGVEKAPAGTALHGVADEGVPIRVIAEVIGKHLKVPVQPLTIEEAANHFGWLSRVLAVDGPASNTLTRELLGWHPTHPGLIADLEAGHYFEDGAA